MHYAAIKGKSTVINALFMLHKSNGSEVMQRVPIDPNYVEPVFSFKKSGTKLFNKDISKINKEIKAAELNDTNLSLADQLPKIRKYSDEFKEDGDGQINIRTGRGDNDGDAEIVKEMKDGAQEEE